MLKLALILITFFSYGMEEKSLDENLKETLKVQSHFPSYRVYYDYKKTIKEVQQELENPSSEEEEDKKDS